MGTLSIDDKTYAELAELAKSLGLTADQQAETWLRESIERYGAARDVRDVLTRVAAMTPNHVAQTDVTRLLRATRRR